MIRPYALLISFVRLATIVSADPGPAKSYVGTQIVRVPAGNATQEVTIRNIISQFGFSTWATASAVNRYFDIVVPPTGAKQFSSELSRLGVSISVMHNDLQESISKESKPLISKRTQARTLGEYFSTYHSYTEHMDFIGELTAAFPNNTKPFTIGTSWEGRQITGINIFGSMGPGTKPAVIFFGTIHARDWISTMVTEYLSYNLLNDISAQSYLETYDFYIVPVVNPDGFIYSQTSDRVWRKNRAHNTSERGCVGEDLNRNFPYKWGSTGASVDMCSDTYRGLSAGSAPEVAAMANFLTSKGLSNAGTRLFINFESYGNLFLSPYAWTESEVPPTNDQIRSVAREFATTVRTRFGTHIVDGTFSSVMYTASGTAVDFAFEVAKIPYTFVHMLRDSGKYGFVLPPDQIIPSGLETYDGVRYLLDTLTKMDEGV